MRRTNFLFIITDQQRADHLGCAGHPVLRFVTWSWCGAWAWHFLVAEPVAA